jgi:hypothetical protein
MSDKREMSRAKARRRRALARDVAFRRTQATCELLKSVLAKVQLVLADKAFRSILYSEGIHSLPRDLAGLEISQAHVRSKKDALDVSLQFVIAWTFLFPIFKKPEIATYLEKVWPGFIQQLKDAFITIVVEGPFPSVMSGHRGRRHGAAYNPSTHRHVRINCRRSRIANKPPQQN